MWAPLWPSDPQNSPMIHFGLLKSHIESFLKTNAHYHLVLDKHVARVCIRWTGERCWWSFWGVTTDTISFQERLMSGVWKWKKINAGTPRHALILSFSPISVLVLLFLFLHSPFYKVCFTGMTETTLPYRQLFIICVCRFAVRRTIPWWSMINSGGCMQNELTWLSLTISLGTNMFYRYIPIHCLRKCRSLCRSKG
jgi:hypothetical protein